MSLGSEGNIKVDLRWLWIVSSGWDWYKRFWNFSFCFYIQLIG